MAEKPSRSKSRFLSPISASSSPRSSGLPSLPSRVLSPSRRKNGQQMPEDKQSVSNRKGLWPSASSTHAPSNKVKSTTETPWGSLADHLGNERLIDFIQKKSSSTDALSLSRQRSCSEFNRFASDVKEEEKKEKKISKENRPFGGSMRFSENFNILSSSSAASVASVALTPGRISVDDHLQDRRKKFPHKLDSSKDILSPVSERSEVSSGTDHTSIKGRRHSFSLPTFSSANNSSSRKSTADRTPSKFLGRAQRGSDHNGGGSSPNLNISTVKGAMQRANSLTGYGSSMSQWALSPGRMQSPPVSGESNGKAMQAFSSLRPPSLKTKSGMGNFLSLGLDLLKGKRSSSSPSLSSPTSSSYGAAAGEVPHQLRLLHNRLLQWRFVNARAVALNRSKAIQAETTFLNAWASLSKLQTTVLQKRVQLEKEKLDIKLNDIMRSQLKHLEAWTEMERQHLYAVSTTNDCLHAVIRGIPLVEGAKADLPMVSIALRNATDLATAINIERSSFFPMMQKSGQLLSDLANVAVSEKTLLEECKKLLGIVVKLEVQERSLRCSSIQTNSHKLHQLQVV